MSFQFNFSIDESDSSSLECELNTVLNKTSPHLPNKGENPRDNKLPLREKEVQATNEVKDTGLMTSSSKTNIFCSGISSNDCLAQDKTAWSTSATEHKLPEDVSRVLENKIVETISGLHFVNVSVVEMTLSGRDVQSESIVSKTVKSNSDLISGVYEGGMKIWECTFDLVQFLEDSDVEFGGKNVLDLGCGAGLLGILALKRKAKEVHFQDYNNTVIGEITIPNVLVNCDEDNINECIKEEPSEKMQRKSESEPGLLSKCRFFSGEWTHFLQLMQNETPPQKYDIILTSETIYNPTYYNALHDVFQHLLAKNGTVYLAAKSHYFGVGGGVHLFEKFVKEIDIFSCKTLQVYDDGLQRQLLSFSFANKV
ncbi:histidine protein methyltransferase 1 homolog [Pelodytes ibericus]